LEDLVRAVRDVLVGKRYLSDPISERVIELYIEREKGTALDDPYETLTNREREVLQMVAEGMSSTEIAERLFIGVRTVETHRANMMHKLNLKNQADVIRYAFQRGILSLNENYPTSE